VGSVVWAQVQVDWFTDVNELSADTPWLHAPFRFFAEYGVVLFAALLLLSWWLARGERDLARVAAAVWAPVGALLAIGLNHSSRATSRSPGPTRSSRTCSSSCPAAGTPRSPATTR